MKTSIHEAICFLIFTIRKPFNHESLTLKKLLFLNQYYPRKGWQIFHLTISCFLLFNESKANTSEKDFLQSKDYFSISAVEPSKPVALSQHKKEKKFFKNLLYDLRKKYRHLKKRERDEIVASTIITVILVLFGLALLLLFLEWLGAAAVGYVFFFGGALAIIVWAFWIIDKKRKQKKLKKEQ